MTDNDLKLLSAIFAEARDLVGDLDEFAGYLSPGEDAELLMELPQTGALADALHQFYLRGSFVVP